MLSGDRATATLVKQGDNKKAQTKDRDTTGNWDGEKRL